ncbi:MAG: ABC transporter ATP-binding protein [Rhodothalassiaceae bacterium]
MTPAARLEDVRKRFRATVALDGVTLDIPAGQCLALVGHNGSGKSTLIKTLLGFVHPDDGRVAVLGRPPQGRASARAAGLVGYVPENVAFDPGMSGREVMRFYARLKRVPVSGTAALLAEVGLAADADRPVRQYSKGMRQRLGLAQALLGAPRLLLLDEPTTGLDPAGRRLVYDIVAREKRAGAAVLLSSHALDEIENEVDRVAMLARGRLLAAGTLAEIAAKVDAGTRIRVEITPCHSGEVMAVLPPGVEVKALSDERLVITCAKADKKAVLEALLALGATVRDVEVPGPSLHALYAALLEAREEP